MISTFGWPVTVPEFISVSFVKIILVKYTIVHDCVDYIHSTEYFSTYDLQEKTKQ